MSLKQQLASRELPSVTQAVRIKPSDAAEQKLGWAQRVHAQAERKNDPAERKRTKAALARAQKAFDACFAEVVIHALPPSDYEALIAAHPATDEQMRDQPVEERPQWNRDTFRPALLAACAEGDMTEADWADFLNLHASRGEGDALFVAALAVNESARLPEAAVLPKGSQRIHSSLWNSR